MLEPLKWIIWSDRWVGCVYRTNIMFLNINYNTQIKHGHEKIRIYVKNTAALWI
jgi:hypothetical protein